MEEKDKAEHSFFCKKSEISRKAVYLSKSLIFPEKCQVQGFELNLNFLK